MENIDFSLVDWSRAQFALTAMYHWIFVPLTLGLAFLIAYMETIYVKTGNPEWKRITKFWMTLFGINFAIGVATGIILEFEFGTNWSNYSWFVGDIFGAPLAIEGIFAFFLESTFIAIMFFGWEKVSKKTHLLATWLVAFGASLSALWILVANAWMQNPVGMQFNPDTARNEMLNFWEVFFNPVAINKFLHTIASSYSLAAMFVIGVSAWYLLKKRHIVFAKKSIVVASVFGLSTILFTILTGDGSARMVAKYQPMKFAAMEGLYQGTEGAGLVAIGFLSTTGSSVEDDYRNLKDFNMKIEIPNVLSYMAFLDWNAFVPGIKDLVEGNPEKGIMPIAEKVQRGKMAIRALKNYKAAKNNNNQEVASQHLKILRTNYPYFGYGYFDTDPNQLIPSVLITFYSFHLMVILGGAMLFFFIIMLILVYKNRIETARFWLKSALFMAPMAWVASQSGWVTAEVGRQPWVIQDIMPTMAAVSQINTNTVIITFILFAVIFTALLIAELKIMFRQIHIGPKDGGH